jgi:hypothetical protein
MGCAGNSADGPGRSRCGAATPAGAGCVRPRGRGYAVERAVVPAITTAFWTKRTCSVQRLVPTPPPAPPRRPNGRRGYLVVGSCAPLAAAPSSPTPLDRPRYANPPCVVHVHKRIAVARSRTREMVDDCFSCGCGRRSRPRRSACSGRTRPRDGVEVRSDRPCHRRRSESGLSTLSTSDRCLRRGRAEAKRDRPPEHAAVITACVARHAARESGAEPASSSPAPARAPPVVGLAERA